MPSQVSPEAFSQAFSTVDSLTGYLQSQGIRNGTKAFSTARTVIGFLLEGKPLPEQVEQTELPLAACPAPSPVVEDEGEEEDELPL